MNKSAWIVLAIVALAGISLVIRPNPNTGIKQRMTVTEKNIPRVIVNEDDY